MKTLIIYESTHGSTEKCANRLKTLFNHPTDLVSLKVNPDPHLEGYDSVIIGGSIHGGQMQSGVTKFITENSDSLTTKKLGLYLCCMEEGEVAIAQFRNAYPESLRMKAIVHGLFGGELNFNKMNRTQKLIAEKVTGIRMSVSKINDKKVVEFARKFENS
jgi:menaquinone-dependent protoporphyrinogen oxidase